MSMRTIGILLGAMGIVGLPFLQAGGAARQAEAKNWLELLPGEELKGWKRVAIEPETTLNPKNPWSVDSEKKVLICDGAGVKEMLLYDTEFKDGVFHLEWRFRKVEDKEDYNSGVYVRTAADGKIWHQIQVAHLKKPPFLGDIFGETLVEGKRQKFLVEGSGTKSAHPPGEWNTYDITCKGKKITTAVNGVVATTWNRCQVPAGHIGLQAEYFFIEFKNLKFRPLD